MPTIKPTPRALVRQLILRALRHTGAWIFELATLPLTVGYKGTRWLTQQQVQKIVDRLTREGELERQGPDRYVITPFGVTRMLPTIRKTLATDGKTRVLVFDIPESERRLRDSFRRHIKGLGFKQHQRSVWISKYNCEEWIEDLVDYHRVGEYVSLYVGEHVW